MNCSVSHAVNETAIKSWIYPSNYPIRQYQRDIVEQCLFKNTLVSLPTGLGKTLIAAVVMFNFYRWFPTGKIIFMAPTRPLVSQQINACHDIMGIPQQDIALLEGSVAQKTREHMWKSKRVFFCTPQVVDNDIQQGRCNARDIVCVVVDEAHRATGNYAYVKVVYEMSRVSSLFRVVALSATPGSDARSIQKVLYNLNIAHVEWRSEEDADVAPYVQEREVEIIKCKKVPGTGEGWAASTKRRIDSCIRITAEYVVTAGFLVSSDPDNINAFVLNEAKRYMSTQKQNIGIAWSALILTTKLCEGRTALAEGGMSALWNRVEDLVARRDRKLWRDEVDATLFRSQAFESLVQLLRGIEESIAVRGTVPVTGPEYSLENNPKLAKLKEILEIHFAEGQDTRSGSRAIVFVALRDTVFGIKTELTHTTRLRVAQFVGQSAASGRKGDRGKGQSQREQEEVLLKFNRGDYNVLIATCVAEEGLDIAEVDLIVSYDVVASPVRMLQRNGRTARKKAGRVVMLVTEGKEEAKVYQSSDSVAKVNDGMRNSVSRMTLYQRSPRMVPDGVFPVMIESDLRELKADACLRDDLNLEMTKKSSLSVILNGKNSAVSVTHEMCTGNSCATSGSSSTGQSAGTGIFKSFAFESSAVGDKNDRIARSGNERVFDKTRHQSMRLVASSSMVTCSICGAKWRAREHRNQEAAEMCTKCASVVAASLRNDITTYKDNGDDGCCHTVHPVQVVSSEKVHQEKSPGLEFTTTTEGIDMGHRSKKDTAAITDKTRSGSTSYDMLVAALSSPEPKEFPDHPIEEKNFRERFPALSCGALSCVSSIFDPKIYIGGLSHTQELHGEQTLNISASLFLRSKIECTTFPAKSHPTEINKLNSSGDLNTIVSKEVDESLVSAANEFSEQDDRVVNSDTTGTDADILPSKNDQFSVLRDRGLRSPKNNGACSSTYQSPESPVQTQQVLPNDTINVNEKSFRHDGESILTLRSSSKCRNFTANATPSPSSWGTKISPSIAQTSIILGRANDRMNSTSRSSTPKHRPAPDSTDLSAPCGICSSKDADENDPGVFCDGPCGGFTHLACYGLGCVPAGDFYCDSCMYGMRKPSSGRRELKCFLCNISGGMLRRSTCGRWVHMICAFYTPDLNIDPDKMIVTNLSDLDRERESLICSICKNKGGANVQCSYGSCLVSMHPYCAFVKQRQMVIRADKDHYPLYEIYCPSHQDKVPRCNLVSTSVSLRCENQIEMESYPKIRIKGVDEEVWGSTQKTPAPRNNKRKRLRRASHLRKKLELYTSPLKKELQDAKRYAASLFDNEAALSGSDSGDDSEHSGDCEGDDSFINDGEYTPAPDGVETGLVMYHELHREFEQTPSPYHVRYKFRGGDKPLPITERLMREHAENSGLNSTLLSDVESYSSHDQRISPDRSALIDDSPLTWCSSL